jgi:hypothetical protein
MIPHSFKANFHSVADFSVIRLSERPGFSETVVRTICPLVLLRWLLSWGGTSFSLEYVCLWGRVAGGVAAGPRVKLLSETGAYKLLTHA